MLRLLEKHALHHNRKDGNRFCHTKLFEAAIKNTIKDNTVIGTNIIFDPETAFKPALLAIAAGTNNNSISIAKGVLLKYIIFKLFAKYRRQREEKDKKSIIYRKAVMIFNILPPKKSATSSMSELINGLKNLQISNINAKHTTVRYIILIHAPVEEVFKIILDKLIIILLLIIVINSAITSTLPIFSILFIFLPFII